jgi:CheY-like chemotaxis protein
MPKLNGYDAARQIREEVWGRDILMIALTGWGQVSDIAKSKDAGFDHHLVKPVEPYTLKKVLANLTPMLAAVESGGWDNK